MLTYSKVTYSGLKKIIIKNNHFCCYILVTSETGLAYKINNGTMPRISRIFADVEESNFLQMIKEVPTFHRLGLL